MYHTQHLWPMFWPTHQFSLLSIKYKPLEQNPNFKTDLRFLLNVRWRRYWRRLVVEVGWSLVCWSRLLFHSATVHRPIDEIPLHVLFVLFLQVPSPEEEKNEEYDQKKRQKYTHSDSHIRAYGDWASWASNMVWTGILNGWRRVSRDKVWACIVRISAWVCFVCTWCERLSWK